MKYKLVVTDIDGTLTNGRRLISERTKQAVLRFHEMGGIFTLATGRIEDSTRDYYEELRLQTPVILYNGAKIVNLYHNQCLYEENLDDQHAKEALGVVKDFPCNALVYFEGKAYVSKINSVIDEYMIKDNISCIETGDLLSWLKGTPTKILIIGSSEDFLPIKEKLNLKCDTKPNMVNSEETYLEILPIGISKGNALVKLSEMLNIPLEQTVAIGDNLNDLEMVARAGLGVAVENAHPGLKKVAKYVTKSNDQEGVAEILEKIINNEI